MLVLPGTVWQSRRDNFGFYSLPPQRQEAYFFRLEEGGSARAFLLLEWMSNWLWSVY